MIRAFTEKELPLVEEILSGTPAEDKEIARAGIAGLLGIGYTVYEVNPSTLTDMVYLQRSLTLEGFGTVEMESAKVFWNILRLQHGMSDEEITQRLVKVSTKNLMDHNLAWPYHHMMCGLRWLDCGFPAIKISPRWAAAALCTRPSEDVLEGIQPPWPAFRIIMPKEPLLYFKIEDEGPEAEPEPVETILVKHFPSNGGWFHSTVTTKGATSMTFGERSTHLGLDLDLGQGAWVNSTQKLAGRLIASVVCALAEKNNLTKIDKAIHEQYEHRSKGRSAIFPVTREFQLTEQVDVDLTEHVRSFQLGERHKGKKLEVQFMVIGHRKMQAHGPGRSLRKQIWVQPYWKGPENAPIAVRPHVLNGPAPSSVN